MADRTARLNGTAYRWIDGRWRDTAQHKDSMNPATEEVIGEYAVGGADEAREAVAAALQAFRETDWRGDRALRSRPHERRRQDCCWGRRSAPAGGSPAGHRVVRPGEPEPPVNLSPGKEGTATSEPVRDPLAERRPTPTVKPFGDMLLGPDDMFAGDDDR